MLEAGINRADFRRTLGDRPCAVVAGSPPLRISRGFTGLWRPCRGSLVMSRIRTMAPSGGAEVSSGNQCVRGLKNVGSLIGISIRRSQRPAPGAGRKRARMRLDAVRGLAVKLVSAIATNFPYPTPPLQGKLP